MSAELRLYPDRLGKAARTGAVGSVQAAELDVREPAGRVMSRGFLEQAAAEYWRVITHFSLGLVRMISDAEDQCVVLIGRPLVLLRFQLPDYEASESEASVTWRIERGILVSPKGRNRGFLRLSLEPLEPSGTRRHRRVRAQMEVRNFYPWLLGRGRFARVGVWIYSQTQQRIHRAVTRRFLKKLSREVAG
jgi:hypothetical protein